MVDESLKKLLDSINEVEFNRCGYVVSLKGSCKAKDLKRGVN